MKIVIVMLTIFSVFSVRAAGLLNLIVVNGIAERSIDPNMAVVQIESWAKASSAKSAQAIQAAQYAKIKMTVDKFKIKKDDFQTENFTVAPEYVYDQKTQSNKMTGYHVNHQIILIYRKADDVGSLVDALTAGAKVESGGVNVQNISWDYDKKTVIENAALADAVKMARAKAEELAQAAGVKIKSVHKIQFQTGSAVAPRPLMQMRAMESMKSGGATEISSGQVKVSVDVQMEFEI